MLTTASDILKRKIKLNEYEHLFTKETSPAVKENLGKLNLLLKLAMPDINSGLEPDIEALAEKAGVDLQTASDLIKQIIGKYGKLRNRKKKK
jgi:hypothetical protein